MRILSLIFIAFLTIPILVSQTFTPLQTPVVVAGTPLSSPWAGGLNAPQWSKVDLNNDGKLDLYAFDRDGFVHIPFLNVGQVGESKYQYAPEFASHFPSVWNFVLLRDFNADGAMDLFCHSQDIGIPGYKVYRGRFEMDTLKFNLMKFNHWFFDVITIPLSNGGYSNLNSNNIDYPAIDDIDGDGDLDIVQLDTDSGRDFDYFRNLALEQGFSKDTLIFKKEDNCWLKVYLPSETTHFKLSGSPNVCATGFHDPQNPVDKSGGLHGASAMATIDMDNDGDKELLYGDLLEAQIMLALNGGSSQSGWATDQDTLFPSNSLSVHMPDFPAPYLLDFDNDGLVDFMTAPNALNNAPDAEVWLYKNVGSNETPVFSFVKKDAMVGDMIDVGKGSHPAFFDFNADGLMDFVIGNFERQTSTPNFNEREASLYLFENVGTIDNPAFELVDDDWLGFRQFSTVAIDPTFQYAPSFGDIDQDGDLDLFVGDLTDYINFVENTGGEGNPATWGPIQAQWNGIRIGSYPKVIIYDLNKDGLNDLIAGEQSGNINFLPNLGTVGNPVFHDNPNEAPNNKFLGAIITAASSGESGFSAPAILEQGEDVYLITGKQNGQFDMYLVDTDKLEFGDTFQLVHTGLAGIDVGKNSNIVFADLNKDNFYDAMIGNRRGGVQLFSTSFRVDEEVAVRETVKNIDFQIYPNPANSHVFIKTKDSYWGEIKYVLFNGLGQMVMQGAMNHGHCQLNISSLSTGLYFVKIETDEGIGMKKLVVD